MYKSFYDERRDELYAHDYENMTTEEHPYFARLKFFIEQYDLRDKVCLEIGSSGGFFQDMVDDYYGTDIAESLKRYYHKPYRVVKDGKYPFENMMFDGIWSITVYEHIPNLQEALLEIKRLLKPGGVVFFAPAWQCRSWAADGYAVRPFSDSDAANSIDPHDAILWFLSNGFECLSYSNLLRMLFVRTGELIFRKN